MNYLNGKIMYISRGYHNDIWEKFWLYRTSDTILKMAREATFNDKNLTSFIPNKVTNYMSKSHS